jgi:hypothetical protein
MMARHPFYRGGVGSRGWRGGGGGVLALGTTQSEEGGPGAVGSAGNSPMSSSGACMHGTVLNRGGQGTLTHGPRYSPGGGGLNLF